MYVSILPGHESRSRTTGWRILLPSLDTCPRAGLTFRFVDIVESAAGSTIPAESVVISA